MRLSREPGQVFYRDGKWRRWKTDAEISHEISKSIERDFFPGVKDRRTRQRILEIDVQNMNEEIEEEIKMIMRRMVKILWAYTQDLDEAKEKFDKLLQVNDPKLKAKFYSLIEMAYVHFPNK